MGGRVGIQEQAAYSGTPLSRFLPIDRCATLLAATGYEHGQLGALPANDATDPAAHPPVGKHTVDERRLLFASRGTDEHSLGGDAELLDALAHCWTAYFDHGRQRLSELGAKVIVAPELAHGYGGWRICVRPDVAIWLRQLLGYVLLDRHNTFRLDTVAVYCG